MTEQSAGQIRDEVAAEVLRDLERTRLRALVASDIIAAEPIHAHDFQLITPRGRTLSKKQYLDAVSDGEIRYLLWQPGDIEVRIHDGIALIRYRAKLQLSADGGARPPFECWHTDSYEIRDGRWQVVWSQATKIE